MAIEIFPDSPSSSLGMSPRISFSHDLSQNDVVPIEQHVRTGSSSSNVDFDFCVFRESFDQYHSSSADELFSDGKILPIEIKRRLAPPPPPSPPALPPPPPPPKPRRAVHEAKGSESEEKNRSFWRFKRSASLNCGSGYGRTLCPLPLLSRSNSTGSPGGGKRPPISGSQKQTILRHNSSNTWQKQTQSGNHSSRPPLKKSHQACHGNGVKFNPVLHVPPANFFGLGSIFSGGKVSSKKKG